jgi:hypothetical protein
MNNELNLNLQQDLAATGATVFLNRAKSSDIFANDIDPAQRSYL